MRVLIVAVLVAVLLALLGGSAVQIAGDVGPGQNGPSGSIPTLTNVAGDVGPGQNGATG